MQDFKVFSLEPIEEAGFIFQISANNYDGHIIIFAKNDFLSYTRFRSFSSSKQGRKWIDDLVSSTRIICQQILDEGKPK